MSIVSNLNVLILHRMGDPLYRRESVESLEYMIPRCRPDLNCIVHDSDLPFPEYLKQIDYHLIILGPTFLCSRYIPVIYKSVLKNFKFIKESSACKIALPQDDYDCSEILDEWMLEWKIDRIYSVLSYNLNTIYSKSIKHSQIVLGYTGYISDEWISNWISPKSHSERTIDVSYRATRLGENFGSHGQLKWQIADKFKNSIGNNSNLNLDISTEKKDFISGKAWHQFLENSKFCLSVASGSSLIDARNEIKICVNMHKARNSRASFEEIENKCFKGIDRKFLFTAISPRNIEAALAETVQIAVPGDYSGLMVSGDHYIPLEKECENINEVIDLMENKTYVDKIKKNCKELILSTPRLRQKNIVEEIIGFTETIISQRNLLFSNQDKICKQFDRYEHEIHDISNRFWKSQRIFNKLKVLSINFGMRRIKNLLSPIYLRYK